MNRYIMTLLGMGIFVGLQAQTDEYAGEYKQTDKEQTDSVAVSALPVDTATATLPWPLDVQGRLKRLVGSGLLERSQLGLMVYDLTADSALFSYGAQQTLRPASTMKLLTAVAGIDRLGGNYQFRTSLYYTGTVVDRTLVGDVYCVGGMDPKFNNDDMNAFVESILRMGVDTIRGQMVADNSFKEESLLGEGWCWDDDNPQLAPLLVSRKDEFMSRFVERLRAEGVTVDAPCTSGRLPNGAYILCSRFHSLDQILIPMMKESDNLYAESMFYQLAASQGTRPARAVHARQVIRQVLGKAGVNGTVYKIADGSGLSLYNYVTPELMVRLLVYAYRNTDVNMHFYPSLPIAGQDGTLKRRLTGPFTNGNVRAKTGTVTGISSLAGYCSAANGHQLAFCVINQGVMRGAEGRAFQDQVCMALCQP